MSWYDYKPYVSVAQRRAQAAREVAARRKRGQAIAPVVIEGTKIAATFWGQAWCDNLEGYGDFESRLPRGRTYVRNGSVIHLAVEPGRIRALVSGSEVYEVEVAIAPLPKSAWQALKRACAGKLGTLVELLQGKLSKEVMAQVTDRAAGLFPKPRQIEMRCNCFDYAGMCKHVAAAMYGVGHRLDEAPELLFRLRGVDHNELIEHAIPAARVAPKGKGRQIAPADLGAIFDIDLDDDPAPAPPKPPRPAAPKAWARPEPRQPAPKTKPKLGPQPAQAETYPPLPTSKIIPEAKFRAIAELLGLRPAPPSPEVPTRAKPTAKRAATKAERPPNQPTAKAAQAERSHTARRTKRSKPT